jgi:acyl-ACP thioesterase
VPAADDDGPELLPRPATGRVFTAARRVRLGDVSMAGQMRIDAVARYLQDVARDDSADSGISNPMGWVVRRTRIDVAAPPVFQEDVQLATWCSGYGGRWAERRTSITGADGGAIETVTLWVHVDPTSGRPARLGPDFFALYGEAAQGRKIDARLPAETRPPAHAERRPWPWRAADFDILAHVNNAAYGAAFEEVRAALPRLGPAVRVDLEYRDPVQPDDPGELAWSAGEDGVRVWVLAGERLCCTGAIRPLR